MRVGVIDKHGFPQTFVFSSESLTGTSSFVVTVRVHGVNLLTRTLVFRVSRFFVPILIAIVHLVHHIRIYIVPPWYFCSVSRSPCALGGGHVNNIQTYLFQRLGEYICTIK